MIEGDEWNTTTLRDTPRTPRRMECVSDLDKVRLERIE
jgi:hypothetical protein